ncbi:MAG: nicotinate phosphoribosyltransferase [Phycisphaerales bacterium]|nr:nicotinate phosphoribosyltransferase [Phycisphaerales bacterium]
MFPSGNPGDIGLLTDLYELTMASGYWRQGLADREAVFHLLFRANPFGNGYTLSAGLDEALDLLQELQFDEKAIAYLQSLKSPQGQPLFDAGFLEYLGTLRFECDVDAVPEGTVVFPYEPMVRVQGPLLQAQVVETMLLTIINFQSLIATKAARIVEAAGGDQVLEFGLRRAQGIDGGLAASRAAFIGGCHATSNVLAGRNYDIPVRGTHAHSWIMNFPDEPTAFKAWVESMPGNAVLLVDTFDTLEGIRNAIRIGEEMRKTGQDLLGIRLDSGDLAYLSTEARRMLDDAGFTETRIIASNDLDEAIIESLKAQGATVDTWGVGTRLSTGWGQPALGGVYKLAAYRDGRDAPWHFPIKLSEQSGKISTPGIQQVRRYRDTDGRFVGDLLYDETTGPGDPPIIVDRDDPTRRKAVPASLDIEDLLCPVMRAGQRTLPRQAVVDIQARARDQIAALHPTIRRRLNPHQYPAGLDLGLAQRRQERILAARGHA